MCPDLLSKSATGIVELGVNCYKNISGHAGGALCHVSTECLCTNCLSHFLEHQLHVPVNVLLL